MIRALFVISLFAVSAYFGGWMGAYGALIICGLLGAIFPARARVRETSYEDDRVWEKVEPARRGSDVDPTRPDDHPLMLTREISRRR